MLTSQDAFAEKLQKSKHDDNDERTYNFCFMLCVVGSASLGGFLFGYDTGSIAGAQIYFENTWPGITDSQIALVVSIALIGAAFGALVSGSISDRIGRKPVIMLADVFLTAGAAIMAATPTIGLLMFGRFVMGIGIGAASQIVPLYLSEMAPVNIRGKIVAFNVMNITSAQLISSVMAYFLRPHWRWMVGLGAIPSLLQFFGMCFLPESPRWLSKAGRVEES